MIAALLLITGNVVLAMISAFAVRWWFYSDHGLGFLPTPTCTADLSAKKNNLPQEKDLEKC